MIRAILALVLALGGGLAGDVDPDPLACPEPDQPNCGAPNGAGGWEPDPAPAGEPATADPTFTG